jgi:2-polyprenyl-3-methyl-5-hydroxy-6-metoxy-1,4-benzoquinol methylase
MSRDYFVERKACPSCRSIDVQDFYRSPLDENPIKKYLETFYSPQGGIDFNYLSGGSYILAECSTCGLIFQKEILSEALLEKLYGEWIDPSLVSAQHILEDDLQHYASISQEVMQIISCFNSVPAKLDFFDFGMGLGQWALMAKAFGCNVSGLEVTKERVELAKANGIKVLDWNEVAFCQFDFINTEQVFEHLANPLDTLTHLVQALKPDGILKISVPTAKDIERRLKIMDWSAHKYSKNSLNPVAPLEHVNFFRRTSLMKMATLAGLKEVHIPMGRQYQYLTNWSGAWSVAMKLLQPVRRVLVKDQNYCLFRRA